jgi:mercuric ion transport protein
MPSLTMGLAVVFFPKCPLCWAAYLSVFGIAGVARIPYPAWLYPLLALMLGIHILLAFRRVPQSGYGPLAFGLGGALAILAGRHYLPYPDWVLIAGLLLIAAGSLWSSFSENRLHSPLPR